MDDPQVANISGDEMKAFLEGDFAEQFNDANWAANWSDASDTRIKSRISPTETADTSISANADGFRKTVMSAVMVTEFADIGLNASGFRCPDNTGLADHDRRSPKRHRSRRRSALPSLAPSAATTRIAAQQKILNQSVLNLEEVDPYDAATRERAQDADRDILFADGSTTEYEPPQLSEVMHKIHINK